MRKENLGKKTKELWKNPRYRKHMSEVHKGQKAWNKGIPLKDQINEITNKERKRKISIGLRLAYKEGRKRKLFGRKKSKNELIKQSLSLKKAYAEGRMSKGESHWNWKGGITSTKKKIFRSLEYKLWRIEVFERDNYTCQECGKVGGKIQADHIKRWADFPEVVFDLKNGQTLCIDCHRIKTGNENKKC